MTNVYEIVTEQVITALEAGTVPWHKPWSGGPENAHRNLVSGKPYRGINPFLLEMSAYAGGLTSPYWLTFKQAVTLGGHVRKGSTSTLVVFFKITETTDRATGEPRKIPVLRYYRLFNLDQVEDVTIPANRPMPDPSKPAPVLPVIDAGEAIVTGYVNAPRIREGEPAAWYRVSEDLINMPPRSTFDGPAEWYSTLFHEMGHSTGHPSRLDRCEGSGNAFGSHEYGREELVAEMTAAFLCAESGIVAPFDNSAAYLASWLRVIRGDAKAVVVAAGKAQKAADLILGRETVAGAAQAA